jgi:putative transposase
MEVRLSAHGAYQHQYHVVWTPKYRRRILRGAIKIFVQEQLPQIQPYHPDVTVQQWSVQIDHIHVVMVIPPKYAVSSIVGKMKANLSRQLRLRYPELKRTYWGAVLWSPGFFSFPVGLNEAVIRRYVDHQERVGKGHMQLTFEF